MGKNFMGYNNASELITAIGNKIKAKYSKPSGGIPKSDLATGVQSSLEKADSALQSYTETDPTVPSWAKQSNKPTYTQDEVGDGTTYKRVTSTEKNTWNSKYSKPSGGIPKTDLASAVQTSLNKADSALQSYTETDPTVPSWAKASSKPSYTASEVGAVPNTSAGVSAAINLLSTGDSTPTDNDYYVAQYVGGGTSTTTYHRRPVSKIWEYIKGKLASKGSATQPVYFSNGVPVATTYTLGKSVPSDAKFTDTTYSAATTSAAGLMSAADKTKLNGIATGAQVNSITGVKGNAESSYRTGNVNLTPANIGAAAASDVAVTSITKNMYDCATANGIVDFDYCEPCINKHGRHVTGFVWCDGYTGPPQGRDTLFTMNSGYIPSTQVPIVVIPSFFDASPNMGLINENGVVIGPYQSQNWPFIILFDYFTA